MDLMDFATTRIAYIRSSKTLDETFRFEQILERTNDELTIVFRFNGAVSMFFMNTLLGKFQPHLNANLTYFTSTGIYVHLQPHTNYSFVTPSWVLTQEPVVENKLLTGITLS